jgi:prepilin-type processing-associated H-X9-DG protein/prepilin-type N-terminal cleavage/methylation domain-containing protein
MNSQHTVPADTGQTAPTACQRRAGFTLVELLVVIGIIALLIAILLPALSKARAQSLQVACMSNLRSMGQALVMYTNDTKYYPGCYSVGGGIDFAIWPTRLRWAMRTSPVTGGVAGQTGGGGLEKLFWCPASDPGLQWQVSYGAPGGNYATDVQTGFGYDKGEFLLERHIRFSYAYNDWGLGNVTSDITQLKGLGGDVRPGYNELKASRVKVASEMIAIGDSAAGGGEWNFNLDPLEAPQYPSKIHREGANILFCDGHVAWYSQKELITIGSGSTATAASTQMNMMWNNDHQVFPGR